MCKVGGLEGYGHVEYQVSMMIKPASTLRIAVTGIGITITLVKSLQQKSEYCGEVLYD